MDTLAEVLINRPSKHLDRTFTYRIPAALSHIGAGWRCVVPFSGHTEEGILVSVRQEEGKNASYQIRDIAGIIDAFPWFSEVMLELARWISLYYMCTYLDALRLFLIDKKGIRTETFYRICWDRIPQDHPIRCFVDPSIQELTEEDAALALGDLDISSCVARGYLQKEERTYAMYHVPLEKWLAPVESAAGSRPSLRQPKQAALWEFLQASGACPVSYLKGKGFSSEVIQNFSRKGWGKLYIRPKDTFSLIEKTKQDLERILSPEQQAAYDRIRVAIDRKAYEGLLLMGVTGSGKTEVYLRAAEHVRRQGGSILILVPEIALTSQMVDYFAARFGDDVVFIHSQLSKGERYNNRMRIQQGESHIVIGSRSALFLPYRQLGLIIVDEEYDSSYKQDETPRYNGRDVAKKMAVLHQCPIVLGAATPSVVTYAAALQGQIELVEMKSRIHHTPLPRIQIVDMKEEAAAGNTSIYSRELIAQLKRHVEAGNKAILFLNRRGYATTLLCRDCGYVFKCPHCDVSLVYHKERHCLKCHYCESVFPIPAVCPKCGGSHIAYMGRGTEKVEEQLQELLPGISCRRLDLDSTSRKHSSARILEDFREGRFSVLLGTQMVTKGHDIPGVQMVGILSADSLLNMPTYLASEQAYILMTQCAGRAGRSTTQGSVILQTYDTDHYVIHAAVKQDYQAFYQKEIQFRKCLQYPPFARMMKITCFSQEHEAAQALAETIYRWLTERIPHLPGQVRTTPPYDEPIKKIRNIYYISLLIKGASLVALKTAMRGDRLFQKNGILIDVDPVS